MSDPKTIRIAILAMGGEGGGVLTNWLARAAEEGGYLVQTTSVPGVAQRTGATIYYVELFPRAEAEKRGKAPILGLMPIPGDVDLVIASELMEAGRAILRGLVTPDRTTLVASTHRVYSMTEKTSLADGRVDSSALLDACRSTAARFVGFDMAEAAEREKSVISAVLLGAVAGSGALPLADSLFEDAIRESGVSVAKSLDAFQAGRTAARESAPPAVKPPAPREPRLPSAIAEELSQYALGPALPLVLAGIERTAEYQDEEYAALYWQRLLPFVRMAAAGGLDELELLAAVARQLALGMTYLDTIRVAGLKLRASRFARIRGELGLGEQEVLEVSEYMHPRIEEVADTMPAGLGRWLLGNALAKKLLTKVTSRGLTIRTTSLGGFLMLYAIASLKPWRRRTLRFAKETGGIEAWLDAVRDAAKRDLRLAVSLADARGLLKGYGETYRQGFEKFQAISGFVKSGSFLVSADNVRLLTAAAQAEEGMAALETAFAKLKAGKAPAGHAEAIG